MINKAAELGPQRHAWWPDWRGECCAVVGSGHSIKSVNLGLLRERIHVVAIKSTVDLTPWAEVCYGCDAAWWLSRAVAPAGSRIFHGSQASHKFPGMRGVEIEMGSDEMLVDYPLRIGNGGNSGFQALNLCIQFGAKDIILLGIDCHARQDLHWYGRNKWPNANNPMQSNFDRWKSGFETAKKGIARLGVDVVNCSPDSELKSFRRAPLEQTLEEWGL